MSNPGRRVPRDGRSSRTSAVPERGESERNADSPDMRPSPRLRRCLEGAEAIAAALARRDPVCAVFVARSALTQSPIAAIAADAQRAGAIVHAVGPTVLQRFARNDADVIALLGPPPSATLDEMMAERGAAWLLAGLAYPTNAGSAIRTAEVSGADGVVVDSAFTAAARRTTLRASMRADRVMPVLWDIASRALDAADRSGRRVVAVESAGATAPWDVDLTGPVLLVAGGERDGIPPAVLARCDVTVCVPMAGFIPSYNVQAAIAAVAAERLRQLDVRRGIAPPPTRA
jgi:tRNA G18 (ribose-2'-O)-methylase SpoU